MSLVRHCSRLAAFSLLVFGTNVVAKPQVTLTRDVAIVGGGASGAYAAVRLREDFGKSVVVIEKQDHLVRYRYYSELE